MICYTAAGNRTATRAGPCEWPLLPGFPAPAPASPAVGKPRALLQPGAPAWGGIRQALLGGGRSLDPVPLVAGRLSSVCSSPFLFLIGTLMRAEGADPLPGAQFMPRLSHSSRRTRTTRRASGRPGAPALGDGLSDRGELAAEVCGCCTVLSASTKGRAGPAGRCSSRAWGRMTSSSLAGAEVPLDGAPDAGETTAGPGVGHGGWGILGLQEELVQETSSSGLQPLVQAWARFSANAPPDCAGPFACCATLSESDNLSGPESPPL